jgi:hypothetical protein
LILLDLKTGANIGLTAVNSSNGVHYCTQQCIITSLHVYLILYFKLQKYLSKASRLVFLFPKIFLHFWFPERFPKKLLIVRLSELSFAVVVFFLHLQKLLR